MKVVVVVVVAVIVVVVVVVLVVVVVDILCSNGVKNVLYLTVVACSGGSVQTV